MQPTGTTKSRLRSAGKQEDGSPTLVPVSNRRSGIAVRRPAEFGELLKVRLALGLPFSILTPLHLISHCRGFKGLPEGGAFRIAVLRLVQPSLLAMRVGGTWSCIGPIITVMAAAIGRLLCLASVLERIIGTVGGRNHQQPRNRNRLRQRQEYYSLRRTPLCVPDAMGSPDAAVTTI